MVIFWQQGLGFPPPCYPSCPAPTLTPVTWSSARACAVGCEHASAR